MALRWKVMTSLLSVVLPLSGWKTWYSVRLNLESTGVVWNNDLATLSAELAKGRLAARDDMSSSSQALTRRDRCFDCVNLQRTVLFILNRKEGEQESKNARKQALLLRGPTTSTQL